MQEGVWPSGRCWLGVSDELTSHPPCLQKGPLDLIETGKGLKVQTDKPHLVSLGSGRLSTAITLVPLEEGKSGSSAHLSVCLSVCLHIPALLLSAGMVSSPSLLPWPLPPRRPALSG